MDNKLAQGSNLRPMTSREAFKLYVANHRKPFSFLNAPYMGLKTMMAIRGTVVVAPLSAGRGRLAHK